MREKILRVTARLISKNGAKFTSTRAICEAVGITAPTLYHYFRDKSHLLEEVTSLAFDKHVSHIQTAGQELQADPVGAVKKIWDTYMEFAANESELYLTMQVAIAQGKILKSGQDCFESLIQIFRVIEQQGILKFSAVESAQMYLGAAQGLALLMTSQQNAPALAALSQKSRDFTLQGLIHPADPGKQI